MIEIGATARRLRDSLGWTQRATADALSVSYVHLCNIENGKAKPSQELLDRFRKLWGIDLYVLAWCDNADIDELPPAVRSAASELATAWQSRIDRLIREQRKLTADPCSDFAK